jgi:NAD(P)H-flavin reductase
MDKAQIISKPGDAPVAGPMTTEPFTIRRVVKDTYDTFTLEMVRQHGSRDFRFKPGQFNMLYVFGTGEVPISISGDPGDSRTLTHTIREVGAVTKVMRRLKTGDSIGVRGPYGTAWPVDAAEGNDVVIVAGGIGLAPLRPAIHYLLANRQNYGKIVLLYGARTPEDILYHKDLERWRARFDLETHVTVDRAAGTWYGNVGVVTTLIGRASFDPHNAIAMVCGPEIMMRFTLLELERRGLMEQNIYLSMERNMKCGVGLCGHCQLGPRFVCKDGPVYRCDNIRDVFSKREL